MCTFIKDLTCKIVKGKVLDCFDCRNNILFTSYDYLDKEIVVDMVNNGYELV